MSLFSKLIDLFRRKRSFDAAKWMLERREPESYRASDDEVVDAIRAVPEHFAQVAYQNAQGSNGTITMTAPATPGVTWNLTSASVSLAGPTLGPNGKVTVYDGAVGGTVLHSEFLPGPGSGSVGTTLKLSLPVSPQGFAGVQGTPGNAMTVQVTGTGVNQVSINGRFADGLP